MTSWSDLYGHHQQTKPSECPQVWKFTGEIQDKARFSDPCPWCQKPDLRVTYRVQQVPAGITWEVCLDCVCQDDVQVEIDGMALNNGARRDHLGKVAVRLMHETCRDLMRQLLVVSSDMELQEIAVYFDRNGQLSPARAAKLLSALAQFGMNVDARIFEVQIRSAAHKKEFAGMTEKEKLLVWPALSPAIKRKFNALKTGPKRQADRGAGEPFSRGR